MGLFSRKKIDEFVSPATGKLVHLDKVSDPVFSQKLMGDGFAIMPTSDEIVAPIGGIIGTVFPTKHALMITSAHGLEIMLHLGIDTVELNGKPFEMFVKENDTVVAGQKLATMDLAQVQAAKKATSIMTIITNSDAVKDMGTFEEKNIAAGETALDVNVN
ncbi:PTS sugar transporter subunit IIA [Companilactobacillus kimchiensis]|uniref:PTS system, glucose glucoside-specific enzyme IIA component n=1 Tax=Companilactobacillus kimchiensis TaxID=993692 RepID=A0A0R2LGE3_9LACO|nr:PTS glucose transporter subunit IIA [Companilactobacillus kimchiensis]KRO00614.1 PTS system, glucose glucoside-specific enzyme IIA component [Companilactobacillus kimchiensis]